MKNDTNKQIILSIVGVFILVVAVMGVSFAFFSYSKMSGNKNSTALVTLNFKEGDTINLTNHFPISYESALEMDESNLCSFSVTGNDSVGKDIKYKVYAVLGDELESKTRFANNEIRLNIKSLENENFVGNDINSDNIPDYYGNEEVNASYIANDIESENGLLLGTGTISASEKAATHNYQIRMWVSDDVSIGDEGTYSEGSYRSKYYSIKIKVVTEQ